MGVWRRDLATVRVPLPLRGEGYPHRQRYLESRLHRGSIQREEGRAAASSVERRHEQRALPLLFARGEEPAKSPLPGENVALANEGWSIYKAWVRARRCERR